jgi:hypothetical protein
MNNKENLMFCIQIFIANHQQLSSELHKGSNFLPCGNCVQTFVQFAELFRNLATNEVFGGDNYELLAILHNMKRTKPSCVRHFLQVTSL